MSRPNRSSRARKANWPPELGRQIDVTLAAGIAQKPFFAGETVKDVVARHCPGIYAIAESAGYTLHFDIPANTHKALCRGRVRYELRPVVAH